MAKTLGPLHARRNQFLGEAERAASSPRSALRHFVESYVGHLQGRTTLKQVEAYAQVARGKGWPKEILRTLRRILRAYHRGSR